MNYSEVELLSRAHQLFAGDSRRPGLDAGTTPYGDLLSRAAAEWQIIAQSDGQDEKVEPCRSKPGLR